MGREFFVLARTLIGVKLLTTEIKKIKLSIYTVMLCCFSYKGIVRMDGQPPLSTINRKPLSSIDLVNQLTATPS